MTDKPEDIHLTILRDTVTDLREMSTPNVSTRGWQRGWRAGVDLCAAILGEIADEYEADAKSCDCARHDAYAAREAEQREGQIEAGRCCMHARCPGGSLCCCTEAGR